MSHQDPLRQRVIAIADPVCTAAGFDLVDLRLKSEQGGAVLRVYIDVATKPDVEPPAEWWLHGVDLNDCERLSRELGAVLDVDDPIPYAYTLEVSSPGIDRPLRTPAHFARFIGAEIKVAMAVAQGDRRNYRGVVRGLEGTGADAHAVVEVDNQTFRLRIADMDTARLVPNWDAVMKGGSGIGPAAPTTSAGGKPGAKARAKRADNAR
jgi:ribosome maturation factor RimP